MGVEYRPEDILKGKKERVKIGLRDLNPEVRDSVLATLEAWEGKRSDEKLAELIGKERAKRLLESLKNS